MRVRILRTLDMYQLMSLMSTYIYLGSERLYAG
jgi:hypothetical protein